MSVLPQSDTTSLLVPVYLDAWSVSPSNQQLQARAQPNYQNLSVFKSPLPASLLSGTGGAGADCPGIHLQWALPDALTHGEDTSGDGVVDFPAVPNRWMVARFQVINDVWTLNKVSVIQSDYLDSDGNTGSTPFLDPTTATSPGSINPATIGKSWTITDWETADPGTGNGFLQAVGPGNATFSAFTPFMQDVFSYIDPPADLPIAGSGLYKFAYLVTGWYSDPSDDDPLAGATAANFASLLSDLKWSIGGTVAAAPPTTTLYHGLVFDVEWH